MKELLLKVLLLFNLRITRELKIIKLEIKNVFKSNYTTKVLISYITSPFKSELNYSHSNLRECYAAAEIFHTLGYCVDVVEFSLNRKIDYSKYDILYGMGPVLERSFYTQEAKSPIRIFYATGCNPVFSDVETVLKVRDFYNQKRRLLMGSSRIIKQSQHAQIFLSEAVIVLGNEYVQNTYRRYDPKGVDRYVRLNAFYNDVYDIDLENKDFSLAKKHFLWFGSGGLIHKGLDILLDIFSQRKDLFLHICGASMKETGFFDYYKDLLSTSSNIINHGFVKMESDEFKRIMHTCGYAVFPSVSEGGSPALLNTMANGGVIPIITRSSGLDMDEYGWIIDAHDINLFSDAINEAALLADAVLKEKAIKVKSHVRKTYTYENYKKNLSNIIEGILVHHQNQNQPFESKIVQALFS